MKSQVCIEISQKSIIYPMTQMITDKATNSVHLGENNGFSTISYLFLEQIIVKQELFTKRDLWVKKSEARCENRLLRQKKEKMDIV